MATTLEDGARESGDKHLAARNWAPGKHRGSHGDPS
jgi:hypothetical protein